MSAGLRPMRHASRRPDRPASDQACSPIALTIMSKMRICLTSSCVIGATLRYCKERKEGTALHQNSLPSHRKNFVSWRGSLGDPLDRPFRGALGAVARMHSPRRRGLPFHVRGVSPCFHGELRDRVASTTPRKCRRGAPRNSGAEIQTRMSIVRGRTIAHG